MQAEQTIVELAYNIFCAQEVIEQPSLPKETNVGAKYGGGVRSEIAWLIYCNEYIFELKTFKLEVTRMGAMSK